MPIISFFGNANIQENDELYKVTEKISELISSKACDIATGAYGGVMEAALKGAVKDVNKIGISCDEIDKKINNYVLQEIKVKTYMDRLKRLVEIGDGYVVMPGGTGTLLEFSAVWALKKRELIPQKPIAVYGEIWKETIETLSFYSEEILIDQDLIRILNTPEDVASYIIDNLLHSFQLG